MKCITSQVPQVCNCIPKNVIDNLLSSSFPYFLNTYFFSSILSIVGNNAVYFFFRPCPSDYYSSALSFPQYCVNPQRCHSPNTVSNLGAVFPPILCQTSALSFPQILCQTSALSFPQILCQTSALSFPILSQTSALSPPILWANLGTVIPNSVSNLGTVIPNSVSNLSAVIPLNTV